MKKAGKILIAAGSILCTILVLSSIAYISMLFMFSTFIGFCGEASVSWLSGCVDYLTTGYLNLTGKNWLIDLGFLINYLVSAVGCLGVPTLILGFAINTFSSKDKFHKFLISAGSVMCGLLVLSLVVFTMGTFVFIYMREPTLLRLRYNLPFYNCYLAEEAPIYFIVEVLKYTAMLIGSLGIPMVTTGVVIKMLTDVFKKQKTESLTEA